MAAGILVNGSFVREFFPDGKVPLVSIIADQGKGRGEVEVKLYQVDMRKVSQDIRDKIITWFKEQGIWRDQAAFDKEGFRVRSEHFKVVSEDLVMFI